MCRIETLDSQERYEEIVHRSKNSVLQSNQDRIAHIIRQHHPSYDDYIATKQEVAMRVDEYATMNAAMNIIEEQSCHRLLAHEIYLNPSHSIPRSAMEQQSHDRKSNSSERWLQMIERLTANHLHAMNVIRWKVYGLESLILAHINLSEREYNHLMYCLEFFLSQISAIMMHHYDHAMRQSMRSLSSPVHDNDTSRDRHGAMGNDSDMTEIRGIVIGIISQYRETNEFGITLNPSHDNDIVRLIQSHMNTILSKDLSSESLPRKESARIKCFQYDCNLQTVIAHYQSHDQLFEMIRRVHDDLFEYLAHNDLWIGVNIDQDPNQSPTDTTMSAYRKERDRQAIITIKERHEMTEKDLVSSLVD